jgi:ABC-type uncharacterized transport system auxiliary subunit
MKLEGYDYDIDERYRMLLQRVDDITSEIYTLGAFEQRKAFMDKIREIIQAKDIAGDQIAVEVLCWTLEQLAFES